MKFSFTYLSILILLQSINALSQNNLIIGHIKVGQELENQSFRSFKRVNSGGFISIGLFNDFQINEINITKWNNSFHKEWSYNITDPLAYPEVYLDIVETDLGNYYTCFSYGPTYGTAVIKLNANGELLWEKYYASGGSYSNNPRCITTSYDDEGFLLTMNNSKIQKCNENGEIQWIKTFTDNYFYQSLIFNINGEPYTLASYNNQSMIMKLDTGGFGLLQTQSSITMSPGYQFFHRKFIPTGSNKYLSLSQYNNDNPIVIIYDSLLQIESVFEFSNPFYQGLCITDIIPFDNGNGFVISGYKYDPPPSVLYAILIYVSMDGEIIRSNKYETMTPSSSCSSMFKFSNLVYLHECNKIVVCGESYNDGLSLTLIDSNLNGYCSADTCHINIESLSIVPGTFTISTYNATNYVMADTIDIEANTWIDTTYEIICGNIPEYFYTYDTIHKCPGDSVFIHGSWEILPQTFIDTNLNYTGADSISILVLEDLPAFYKYDTLNICEGEIWEFYGQLLDSSGTYIKNFPATIGCDSFEVITLYVDSIPNIIFPSFSCDSFSLNSGILIIPDALPEGGVYSGTGVAGNTFDPSVAGVGEFWITYTYTDQTYQSHCTNADSIHISIYFPLGIESPFLPELLIYPNPASSDIKLDGLHDGALVEIYSINGKLLKSVYANDSELIIDLSELPSGNYKAIISTDKTRSTASFQLIH